MHDYRRLRVWQDARSIAGNVYRLTDGFPQSERFGLTQQMRRAAVSIVSNIAEGAGRSGELDFARFVGMAIGSTCELEAQLELALDLGFIEGDEYRPLAQRLGAIKPKLAGLERSLRERVGLRST